MENTETEETQRKTVDLRLVPPRLKKHIEDQSKKRQLTESEILSECIEYHQENANT